MALRILKGRCKNADKYRKIWDWFCTRDCRGLCMSLNCYILRGRGLNGWGALWERFIVRKGKWLRRFLHVLVLWITPTGWLLRWEVSAHVVVLRRGNLERYIILIPLRLADRAVKIPKLGIVENAIVVENVRALSSEDAFASRSCQATPTNATIVLYWKTTS